jgi:hypothetical protein
MNLDLAARDGVALLLGGGGCRVWLVFVVLS